MLKPERKEVTQTRTEARERNPVLNRAQSGRCITRMAVYERSPVLRKDHTEKGLIQTKVSPEICKVNV